MNYLGRGWASCVIALRDYHRSALRTLVESRTGADAWRARGHLQHLLFDLEVDVAARAGPNGIARMTEVERAVFLPALLRVRDVLGTASIASAPGTWAVSLQKALRVLRHAIADLRPWQPAEPPRLMSRRA